MADVNAIMFIYVIVTDVIVTKLAKGRLWQMLLPYFIMADVNAIIFIFADFYCQ